MPLSPGFLDELRTRLSLSRVVGRKVIWDQRKSNQKKGDMWAPCPFHHEKTASFHVDDRKGFYYCFGCQVKGDAISFVRETENVSFIESVEILAGEAGLTMPARDPKAQEKYDRCSRLAEVMEQAVKFYSLQLKSGAGRDARDYLTRRGLDTQALDRWEIGFAPGGWRALWDYLRDRDVAEELVLGAGLAKSSNKGNKPYDTFRNRIMFPIRDPRGRCIAFGGRAMDPNDSAKYLNSPETELFEKRRSLYNHGPARQEAGQGRPLIVAEGYMDVIALAEAGFGASVAPLGTAITEHQLQMLWRISNEAVIVMDGDTAGRCAAMRTVDLALPLLEAGNSLRFALMPEGKDPDDLLRADGSDAVRDVLEGAIPMIKLLWQRETDGKVFDSPERKAALDKSLREKITLIRDPSIQSHYVREFNDLRWQLFRPQRQSPKRTWPPHGNWRSPPREPDTREIFPAVRHIAVIPGVSKPGDVEKAGITLTGEFAKIEALRELDAGTAEPIGELPDLDDETPTYRLARSAEERNRTNRNQNEDKAHSDGADNGARVNRDRKNGFDSIISSLNFEMKGRAKKS